MKVSLWLALFIGIWILFCLYSFTQKDLNLTLYNLPFLQQIQDIFISIGYYQRTLSMWLFTILSTLFILSYLVICLKLWKAISKKQLFFLLAVIFVSGLISYPMFSHDIYNYIFNAKMVLVYNANPHIQTANQFPNDPWIRFMHNVHTAAPYGYGWTALSLFPVALGLPRFTTSLFLMKGLVCGFFFLEAYLFYQLAKKNVEDKAWQRLLLFVLNPLLLIETINTGHNDSVMMAFLFLALLSLLSYTKSFWIKWLTLGIFWALSISIKYATVILGPLFLVWKKIDILTWGGLALLAVLLSRPGQLNSWYLHWGIALLLLSKHSWAVMGAVLLSVGGLLRYAPYVYYGSWDPPVPVWRWVILLVPLALLGIKKVRLAMMEKYETR